MSRVGRPRKAELNQVVSFGGSFGVVVDYDPDREWGKYLVIRSDPLGRHPYGRAIWMHSTEFKAIPRHSRRPGVIYRANLREEKVADRGCTCQCCKHYEIPTYDEPDE